MYECVDFFSNVWWVCSKELKRVITTQRKNSITFYHYAKGQKRSHFVYLKFIFSYKGLLVRFTFKDIENLTLRNGSNELKSFVLPFCMKLQALTRKSVHNFHCVRSYSCSNWPRCHVGYTRHWGLNKLISSILNRNLNRTITVSAEIYSSIKTQFHCIVNITTVFVKIQSCWWRQSRKSFDEQIFAAVKWPLTN